MGRRVLKKLHLPVVLRRRIPNIRALTTVWFEPTLGGRIVAALQSANRMVS